MINKYMLGLFVVLAVVLVSCSSTKVVCNNPYILVGDHCCLDKNADGICDTDTAKCEPANDSFDCSSCPPQIVTETKTVEVYKYVCDNGTVVDNAGGCKENYTGVVFNPITTNEDDTAIEDFSLRPACRSGFNVMELHYKTKSTPNNFEVQVKTKPDEAFKTVFKQNATELDKYIYGMFCSGDGCPATADFNVDPNRMYLVRIKFDFSRIYPNQKTQFTNEHVVDATSKGEYMTKLC